MAKIGRVEIRRSQAQPLISLDRISANLLDRYRAILGSETINLVGVLLKQTDVVVRNHNNLKPQLLGGSMHDVDKPRNQLWPQPTILLIKHQESAMLLRIQSSQRKQTQPNAKNILNRSTLTAPDIFIITVSLNRKINVSCAAFETRGCFKFCLLYTSPEPTRPY